LSSGEAVFQVARDAARPFRVHTATAIVQALGTEFNVNQQEAATVVSVLEGRVRVVAQRKLPFGLLQSEPALAQNLGAGEEAQVAANGRIEKKAHPDITKALAWHRQGLTLEEMPLEAIAAEFNRNNATKIRLEGIAPGMRRYGGIFVGDDPEALAAILEREGDLVVERRPGEIVVRPR
jgi:transmembrane sensor